MRSGSKYGILSGLAISLALATPAFAGVTFYTSQSAYQAALTAASINVSSFNFNSTPYLDYDTSAGLTVDGVNFVGNTGTSGYYYANPTPAYYCCDDYNNPNETIQLPAVTSGYYDIPDGSTTITLPSAATAFSFDAYSVEAGNYSGAGQDTLNLDVNGSIGQTTTAPNATTGFLGFISSSPVSSVTLTGSTNEEFIDLVDGTVSSSVPEPSAWAMMLGGLSLVGFLLRRRAGWAGSPARA